MNIGALIQARMASTRLPGKVLLPLADKPMLQFQIERLKNSKKLNTIAIATSTNRENRDIIALANQLKVPVYAGSEEDVLDRFYQAAKQFKLDVIVRITGDCPLIDPAVVDQVITAFVAQGADYANNVDPPTYPDGFDVEVMSFTALERAWKDATAQHHREHVTAYIRETGMFRKATVRNAMDLSKLRLTVDTQEDLHVIRKLVALLPQNFTLQDVVQTIDNHPELTALNAGLVRDEKYWAQVRTWRNTIKLQQSQSLFARAKEHIPCQTQTLSKGWTQFVQGVCPVFLQRGNGSHVWDVDNNEYIDYITGLGPIILGYNDEDVNKAITEQLKSGITFSLPHPLEVELAEDLRKLIPCAEMVRYGKNGSDATTAAIRIARAHTGREKIACCGYHGWQDWYITTTTRKRGVPKVMDSLICTFDYNKIETLNKLFAENLGQIAAVIMEPIGVEDPQPGFLEQVREIAHKNGALLIFDEVVTGFRVAMGGAQSYYKVVPDLAAFGKALSNGMPLSFVAGKKEIMRASEDTFISMTSGGETLSLAAARATLKKMQDKNVITHLWTTGQRLKDGIIAGIKANDLPVEVKGLPVHFVLAFKDASGQESLEFKSLFIQEMCKRGILTGGYFNQCAAHSAEDTEKTLAAARETFAIMKNALSSGTIAKFLEGPAVQPVFRKP